MSNDLREGAGQHTKEREQITWNSHAAYWPGKGLRGFCRKILEATSPVNGCSKRGKQDTGVRHPRDRHKSEEVTWLLYMAQLRPHLHILLSALVTFTKWKNDQGLRWMSLRARELGLSIGRPLLTSLPFAWHSCPLDLEGPSISPGAEPLFWYPARVPKEVSPCLSASTWLSSSW